MGTYLMMLYVTLDQESAVKTLFADQGWTFCKPDLSVTTDKLGPSAHPASTLRTESAVVPGSVTLKRKASSSPKSAPKIKLVKVVSNTSNVNTEYAQRRKRVSDEEDLIKRQDINKELLKEVEFDDQEITNMIKSMKERHRVNITDNDNEAEKVHEMADCDNNDDVGDDENDDTDDSIEGINEDETDQVKLDGTNDSLNLENKTRYSEKKASVKTVSSQKKSPRVSYRTYDLDAMIQAYHAVKNDNMAIRRAARIFHVPEATLRKRVHGCVEFDCVSSGPKGLFSTWQEAKLIKLLQMLKEKNFIKTPKDVRFSATEYAKVLGLKINAVLRPKWFVSFRKRWGPQISDLLSSKSETSVQELNTEPNVVAETDFNEHSTSTPSRAILKALGYT